MEQLKKILNFIFLSVGTLSLILFFVLPICSRGTYALKGFNGLDIDGAYAVGVIILFIGALATTGAGVYGIINKKPAGLLGSIASGILVGGATYLFIYMAISNNFGIRLVGAGVYVIFALALAVSIISDLCRRRK